MIFKKIIWRINWKKKEFRSRKTILIVIPEFMIEYLYNFMYVLHTLSNYPHTND